MGFYIVYVKMQISQVIKKKKMRLFVDFSLFLCSCEV
jgi:hypothetical protein